MEKSVYPKKLWCLYLSSHPEHSEFDGTIGREEEILADDNVLLTIVDVNGYREKDRDKIPFGTQIILKKENLKLGYITKEYIDELYSRIIEIKPNPYISIDFNRESNITSKEARFWHLYGVAGYFNTIKAVTKNNGIVTTELIESLFDNTKLVYDVNERMIGYSLKNKTETITELEALKRYGLLVLDDVFERTVSGIPWKIKEEHKQKATEWYEKHSDHVHKLVAFSKYEYEPGLEDVGNPALWKDAHWKWFLNKEYKKNL